MILYLTQASEQSSLHTVLSLMSNQYLVSYDELLRLYNRSRSLVKSNLDKTAASHSRLLYFKSMLETLCSENPCGDSLFYEQNYWDAYLLSMPRSPFLRPIFELLFYNKIKIGIVSDLTTEIQIKKLIQLGVSRYISALVASEEAGKDKPSLAPFSLIDQKLNPSNANLNYLMVGNDLTKDMLASKHALNAQTILISNETLETCSIDYVDFHVSDLEGLYDLFKTNESFHLFS